MAYRPGPGEAPLHPSFEDRPGAPDRIFTSLSAEELELQVAAWAAAFEGARAAEADVLYLNHLSPLNEAASRIAPDVPRVSQLHGTELLMLETVGSLGAEGAEWTERLRGWTLGCERLVVANPRGAARAERLLGVPPEMLAIVPNPIDVESFRPDEVDRSSHWRRHLVSEPQGWRPGGGPGTVSYAETELDPLIEGVVFLYVGRFTEVKRVPLLIRSFAVAQERFEHPAALVLLGGHPGEWEGQHPFEVIEETGAPGVFLAGWHPQQALPEFAAASDAIVLPSVMEQFGQSLVEGMACGLPGIAVNRGGPAGIVEDGETGRLVPPDDMGALADAMIELVNDPELRLRRGEAARRAVVETYSVDTVSRKLSEVLAEAASA